MTDKEIKKALELCIDDEHRCGECPYYNNPISCGKAHGVDMLALINRYEAEIERLRESNKNLQTANTTMANEFITMKYTRAEAIKEIKAEIIKALESNYKAKFEIMAKPNIDMAYEFISYCEGKIAALRGIDDFVDTLISGETKTDTDFPKDYSYGY